MMAGDWPYVIAAYAITLAGSIGVVIGSWRAMRRAEARVQELIRPHE